jgi:hypothetical protein
MTESIKRMICLEEGIVALLLSDCQATQSSRRPLWAKPGRQADYCFQIVRRTMTGPDLLRKPAASSRSVAVSGSSNELSKHAYADASRLRS